MENNYENYELTEIEEANVVDVDDYTEEEQSGFDLGKLLKIGGLATLAGTGLVLGVKGVKKLANKIADKKEDKSDKKAADKPKKKRGKLRLVRVEDEAIEEEVDSVDEIDEEVE